MNPRQSLDPSFMAEPEVTTEPDGTIVFSLEVPGLVEDSIAVEQEAEGRYRARADASEVFEHPNVPAQFAFEFLLPAEAAGDSTWSYTDDVLRIAVRPR